MVSKSVLITIVTCGVLGGAVAVLPMVINVAIAATLSILLCITLLCQESFSSQLWDREIFGKREE